MRQVNTIMSDTELHRMIKEVLMQRTTLIDILKRKIEATEYLRMNPLAIEQEAEL